MHPLRRQVSLLPGLGLATLVGLASLVVARVERALLGHVVIEGLVVAIILGMLVCTFIPRAERYDEGIAFAAKDVLEVAVLLLGASVDLPLLLRAGPALAAGIILFVVVGIAAGYGLGRMLGLPPTLSVLVACGNAICGNSAIAALGPVIRANKEHIASAIAFTAILGVIVVVSLPLLIVPLGLSHYQYGVLAGLTVYAVPQVLAAAFPVSVLSGQVGTLVKLVRVLMLGPVVLFFAVRHRADRGAAPDRFRLAAFVPWFIVGFLALATLRSLGAISPTVAESFRLVSTWLTVIAMAALGLGVDLKAMRKVGLPIVLTVSASLLVLIVLSIALIHGIGIE